MHNEQKLFSVAGSIDTDQSRGELSLRDGNYHVRMQDNALIISYVDENGSIDVPVTLKEKSGENKCGGITMDFAKTVLNDAAIERLLTSICDEDVSSTCKVLLYSYFENNEDTDTFCFYLWDNAGYQKEIRYYLLNKRVMHSTSVVFNRDGGVVDNLVDYTVSAYLGDVVIINGDAWRDIESEGLVFDFYYIAKDEGLLEAQCYLDELHDELGDNGESGQLID